MVGLGRIATAGASLGVGVRERCQANDVGGAAILRSSKVAESHVITSTPPGHINASDNLGPRRIETFTFNIELGISWIRLEV